MIHSVISFKNIPTKKINGIKINADYKIPAKDNSEQDIFVNTAKEKNKERFCTNLKTNTNINIAENHFKIDSQNKLLDDITMKVKESADRNKGYGAIMHLNNIIELLENDLEQIKLYSLNEAVLFHAKYKFQPEITNYENIRDIMFCISKKNCKKFPELKEVTQKAGNYFDEMFYSFINCYNKDNLKYANDIVQEYFDIINSKKLDAKEKEHYALNTCIDMVLTKEQILRNKDYFNQLFKKYNIDYKIKDPQ